VQARGQGREQVSRPAQVPLFLALVQVPVSRRKR
jgi:hypothetical protein